MKKKICIFILLIMTFTGISVQAEWYDTELQNCKNKGYVTTELFEAPDKYITRGEICELLVSYYEYKNPGQTILIRDNAFVDIEYTKYKDAIEKAFSLGFINGVTNTAFAPDDNVTREQFVSIIYRMNGSPIAETFSYDDVREISDYALSAIDYCVANKIIMGTEKGIFSPKANITRAEAIVIVNRMDDNKSMETGDKKFSGYIQKSETKNYISYITRKFDIQAYKVLLNRGTTMENRSLDVLVVVDKNTGERKFIELEKIVSMHFFDVGDTLYIPICRVGGGDISDSHTQGMYVVDKKTGSVNEVGTPVLLNAFALANDCIYYKINVKTGENSVRPTITKYNIVTKQISMSSQGAIGEFDGNTLLYLSENEAICCRCVDEKYSIYTIDLDTLEMKIISYEPIIAINENYYVKRADGEKPYVVLCDRKTQNVIRNINLADEANLVTQYDLSRTEYASTYHSKAYMLYDFMFFDVNGELFLRYKDNAKAVCITNKNLFDLDFFYCFFNNGYMPDSYYRKDKAFFMTNSYSRIVGVSYASGDMPVEDAAVASLFSRKTYGADEKLNFISEGKKCVRDFCNEYKRKYKNPYDLIRAINNYLTFECDYDDATNIGLPTDRKYSAYSAEGIVIEKSGVCDGYSRTVCEVLSNAGIKCAQIVGGDHGWNVIEIDGKKYFLDATWNSVYRDPDAYYMMSYEEISQDHKADDGWLHLVQ